MTSRSRTFAELIALGIANGLLLGGGLAVANRAHAVPVVLGAGLFITFTYYFMTRRRAC